MSQSVQVPTEGQRLSALHDAFDRGALRQAARMLNALEPAEIAHLLESMPPAERAAAWELVDGASGGEVLLYASRWPCSCPSSPAWVGSPGPRP